MGTTPTGVRRAVEAVGELVDSGARLGAGLLTVAGRRAGPALGTLVDRAGSLGRARSGCEVPPPCWYPLVAAEVTSHPCPGGVAVLRVEVTNCGPQPRSVHVSADAEAGETSIDPGTFDLPALRSRVTTVRLEVPAEGATDQEVLVHVRACRHHVVRWRLRPTARGTDTCHEVAIEDCPDPVHHWYDHFYCQHPCPSGGRRKG